MARSSQNYIAAQGVQHSSKSCPVSVGGGEWTSNVDAGYLLKSKSSKESNIA
jgi:hypothetical protein